MICEVARHTSRSASGRVSEGSTPCCSCCSRPAALSVGRPAARKGGRGRQGGGVGRMAGDAQACKLMGGSRKAVSINAGPPCPAHLLGWAPAGPLGRRRGRGHHGTQGRPTSAPRPGSLPLAPTGCCGGRCCHPRRDVHHQPSRRCLRAGCRRWRHPRRRRHRHPPTAAAASQPLGRPVSRPHRLLVRSLDAVQQQPAVCLGLHRAEEVGPRAGALCGRPVVSGHDDHAPRTAIMRVGRGPGQHTLRSESVKRQGGPGCVAA